MSSLTRTFVSVWKFHPANVGQWWKIHAHTPVARTRKSSTNTSKDAIRVPMTDKFSERKSNFRYRIWSAAFLTSIASSAADEIIDKMRKYRIQWRKTNKQTTFTLPRAARRKIGSNWFSCQVCFTTTGLTAKMSFGAHTHNSNTFSMEAIALNLNKFRESRLIKAEQRWKRPAVLFKLLKTFLGSDSAVESSCSVLYIYFHARRKPLTISKQCIVSRRLKFSFCWAFLRNFPDTCLLVCVYGGRLCKFGYFLRCCQLVSTERRWTRKFFHQPFPPEILLMTRH